jgi:hypothetical protein
MSILRNLVTGMRNWLMMCDDFVTARWACNLDKWRLACRQTSRWSHSLIWSTNCCRVQTNPTDRSLQMVSSFFHLHRYPSIICSASVKKMFLALIQGWNRIQLCLSTTTKSPALDSLIPTMLSMLGPVIGLASGKDLVWFFSAAIFLYFNIVTHCYDGQRSSP